MKHSVVFAVVVGMGALACVSSTRQKPVSTTNASAVVASATATLATGQRRPTEMAVDATHVYWTTTSSSSDQRYDVLRVAKRGGPVETLATDQSDAVGLTMDGTHVYWLARTGECVARRIAKTGGPVATIASGLPCSGGWATTQAVVDDTRFYWTGDGGVRAVAKSGGTPAVVAEARSATLLVQDATKIYWGEANGPLWAQSKSGGAKVKLLEASPARAAVDGSSLYYASAGKIMRLAKAGGAPVVLGPSGGRGEQAISVNDGFVFWTDVVDDQIRRLPVHGDIAAETLVAGERASSLFVDASGTYYVATSGAVRRHAM